MVLKSFSNLEKDSPMRASRHFYRACQVSKNTIELFQNNSRYEKRAFWFVRKLGFKGFEGRPCRPSTTLIWL